MKIFDLIKNRRTIKPMHFNGEILTNESVQEMIDAADWAPTHKQTEPWRFVIFSAASKTKFGLDHAEMFRNIKTKEGKMTSEYIEKKAQKIQLNTTKSSHVIAIVMKRDKAERVPEIEEIAAVACAVQNMMLIATEKNIAHIWSSGAMTFYPEMRKYLGFDNKDKVLGFLYLGKSDLKPKSKRFIPLSEKVLWKQ